MTPRLLLSALLLAFSAERAAAESDNLFPLAVTVAQWKGTPLDAGALNQPLRAADRVGVAGAQFVRVGPDGKLGTADDRPVKFFGVNLAFSANFPTAPQARRLAADLATLGVNIVRIHHIDTRFADAVSGGVSGVLRRGKFPTFDKNALERLRHLIAELAAAGIYVNLNLHVGYTFDVARDQLATPPKGFVFPPKSKPYQIYFRELWDRQEQYACGLVGGLALKSSVALAMLEINNESSLIYSWQHGGLDDKAAEQILAPAWSAYQRERGLRAAGSIVSFRRGSAQDKARFAEFLALIDEAYFTALRGALKRCAGVEVPVTGTQMSHGALAIQHASRGMDFIDTHFYSDHYQYETGSQREERWWINDSSLALNGFYPLDGVLSLRRSNVPFTVGEFNQAWPNRQGHEVDITVAALGLVQAWNGLMHFNYSNDDAYDQGYPRGFNLAGDPARLSVFGQAAKLFRTEEIQAPRIALVFAEADAFRFAAAGMEQRQMGKVVQNNFGLDRKTLLNSRVSSTTSVVRKVEREDKLPTGAVRFEPADQNLTVLADRVWAASGKVSAKKLGTAELSLTFPESAPRFAMVVLSSLDERPISSSRRLLLTVPGPVLRSVTDTAGKAVPERLRPARKGWSIPSPEGKQPSAPLLQGQGPVWMERLPAEVTLRLAPGKLTVFPLNGAGTRQAPLPESAVVVTKGGTRLHLTSSVARATPWYELELK